MDTGYSIAETRDNLARLVHEAERGSVVHITRRGRVVAVLLSADEHARLRAASGGLWDRLCRFRATLETEGLGLEEPEPGGRVRILPDEEARP